MPQLTIEGIGTFDVPAGQRLVLALEQHGGEPLHRCGGWAGCTTCRVEFLAGEPDRMTDAEYNKLNEGGKLGQFRLSCQCLTTHDMHVRVLMPLSKSGLDSPGNTPRDTITPEPVVWRDH